MKKWLSHTNSTVLSVAVIGIFILLTLFLNSLGGFQLRSDLEQTIHVI